MALTAGQKKALHSAARQAGVEDDDYRLVLRNRGGYESSTHPHFSRQGFIACMAMFEHLAGGRLKGCQAGYWADQDANASPLDRLVWHVRKLADRIGMSREQLDAFVAGEHFTGGAYQCVDDLPGHWLNKLIEALRAIGDRREAAMHA